MDQEPQQPSQVGPYRIIEKIGAGGMGTVYRGEHTETGQQVAVKILPVSLVREQKGFADRFLKEIEALRRVSSPHIVKLLEDGVYKDDVSETLFYAMEFVDGETLTSRIRRDRRIPWPEATNLAIQIAMALKAAHIAGVVHRDLKPSNLLIGNDGTLKLTDFGVAHVFATTRLTKTGGVIGTAEYMSPEQAQGKSPTKKSDLYSLGAVMYVMITGRPPFMGKSNMDIVRKHQFNQFDKPSRFVPDIPVQLEQIICQLLEKNPDDRFPDALPLIRRLEQIHSLASFEYVENAAEVATSDESPTIATGERELGIGPATMMRDLMREEVRRQQNPEGIAGLLNNIWVLLGLLGAIILGGFYFVGEKELSAEERFEQGVKLMQSPAGEDWRIARTQFFEPLLQEDPDTWMAEVRPHLTRIMHYEASRSISRNTLRTPVSVSEPGRLLVRAQNLIRIGDEDQARDLLNSLTLILEGDAENKPTLDAANEMLGQLAEQPGQDQQKRQFIKSAISRIRETLQQKDVAKAQRTLTAVVDLYSNDASVAELMSRCHDLQREIDTAAKETQQVQE